MKDIGTTAMQLELLMQLTGKPPEEICQDAVDQLCQKTVESLTDEEFEKHKKWAAEESSGKPGLMALYSSVLQMCE